ncbi:hypothetical protein CSA37_09730 [Candidatus Fermentibacteria bacterium]|nr:MAG: hypothetical protein CSA37_09730 [Candidatus Fermentibacteria bacterium]
MLLLFLLLQGLLPEYSITADPEQLEYLYDNFNQGIEIQGVLSIDSVTADCTVSFRGGASLYQEKKSWCIRVEEEGIVPWGKNLLLNAQFLDPSLMRNTLGHFLTRELGFPASRTGFATLTVNGTYLGVYEQIERVDRYFFNHRGMDWGPVFKSVHTVGRLVCHYADHHGTYGIEPKRDSQPYSQLLLELIEDCRRGDVSNLKTDEFLTLFAVKIATANRDAVIKNFLLHNWQGIWHVYPWDMDASLGNTPGEYIPGWTCKPAVYDIPLFGGTRPLLESWENLQIFNSLLDSCASVMENRFPAVIDSLRRELRGPLGEDPYYQYSSAQFDSICAVLSSDVVERAVYVSSSLHFPEPAQGISSFTITDCLNLGKTFHFSLEIEQGNTDGVVLLLSIDGGEEELHFLPNTGENYFEFFKDLPPGTYSVRITFGPRLKSSLMPVFFPSWSMKQYHLYPVPAPGARVAIAPLHPDMLSPGEPFSYGEFLWVLPVTNTADFTQDLSLCSFHVGNPSGTVFFSESLTVSSGETIYLTNNSSLAETVIEGRIFGDAGTSFPANSQLLLNDPAWYTIHSWNIGEGDSVNSCEAGIIPCEISRGNGNDWIELYNSGNTDADISEWFLMDSDNNVSFIPDKTVLHPGELILVMEYPDSSLQNTTGMVFPLAFSLCSLNDSLTLFSNMGNEIFSFGWDEPWPGKNTVMYLRSPFRPLEISTSWLQCPLPGSPGVLNPQWGSGRGYAGISLTSPNPGSGLISFSYKASSNELEAILYDLSGREITNFILPEECSGSVTENLEGLLPAGVYIIYLRSSNGTDSVKLTVLTEE